MSSEVYVSGDYFETDVFGELYGHFWGKISLLSDLFSRGFV